MKVWCDFNYGPAPFQRANLMHISQPQLPALNISLRYPRLATLIGRLSPNPRRRTNAASRKNARLVPVQHLELLNFPEASSG